jgi:ankyrin repeat protein
MKRYFFTILLSLLLCGTLTAADEDKLIFAAKTGNLKVVQQYIEENYSPDTADKSGKTIIMHAVSAGKYNVAEYLLSKGASANRSDNKGYSAMHILALTAVKLHWLLWKRRYLQKHAPGILPLMVKLRQRY